VSVQTRLFEFQRNLPTEKINKFYDDNNIDRTQILDVTVFQKQQNVGVYAVTYEDTILPEVVGTSPANGASGVPINGQIVVQFSEAVVALTTSEVEVLRNGATVTLTNPDIVTASSKVTIDNAIDGSYNANYVVTMLTTIEDLNGNNMLVPYVFAFSSTGQQAGLVSKGDTITPGSAPIGSGYVDVAFSTPFNSSNYVTPDPGYTHDVTRPSGLAFRISNKIAASFRINFDGAPFPSGAALDWFAVEGLPN